MAENSKIEWCDHTFNPWIGCTKVSEGCANCYAEADFDKRRGYAKWGPPGTRVKTSEANWKKPLGWQKKYLEDCDFNDNLDLPRPHRPRVFCSSLADVFEDWDGKIKDHHGYDIRCGVSDGPYAEMNHIRKILFNLIDATPHLDWLLVTKRPENIMGMWNQIDDRPAGSCQYYRKNVWLLTSVENQEQADKRIPELLKCRELSHVLGLSCEPLLGPIDLYSAKYRLQSGCDFPQIDWVITGGESGLNARPMHPNWAGSLRDQCHAADVPFLFKQWGEWAPIECAARVARIDRDGRDVTGLPGLYDELDILMSKVGKKKSGRMLDGVE